MNAPFFGVLFLCITLSVGFKMMDSSAKSSVELFSGDMYRKKNV